MPRRNGTRCTPGTGIRFGYHGEEKGSADLGPVRDVACCDLGLSAWNKRKEGETDHLANTSTSARNKDDLFPTISPDPS